MPGDNIIADAVRKLNRLELEIRASQRHVQFLRNVDIDARELLRTANELRVASMAMEEYLLRVTGDAENVARRFPARPFRTRNFAQQLALNPGLASAVGYRNELRALARRIPQELDELHKEMRLLAEKANAGMNDPGRWGDASVSTPVSDVVAFVSGVLEVIAKWAQKRRAARGA